MARVPPPSSTLARLLEAAGYRVELRPEVTVAVRVRDRRAVAIVPTARSPAEIEAWFPTDSIQRTIIYDDEPGEVARGLAADRGIEVLDPTTLGPALGELLLPSPLAPAPGPEAADPGLLEPPFAIAPTEARTVRPRLGRTEAEVLAGVEAPRFTLRLVPFFVAAYRVRPASPHGQSGPVQHQLVAVNAVTRRAEVWGEADRELVTELDEPHQRLAPQLTEAQAMPIAIETIRRHHTVHVDHTEQHGGALVIETRRIPPSPEDVRVGPFALLFVPHWYAEGSEGRVVLDAVTGRRTAGAENGSG